jgi:phosphonate transport system ATP-binding protein
LVGRLDVLTNVLIGLLARVPFWRSVFRNFSAEEIQAARAALEAVGLAEFADRRASTLSGGQQQRVAIARCLVQQARVILADEPIASLDPESARNVMEILARINREHGVTVVVSLHQVAYARRFCQRVVALRGGEVVHDGRADALTAETLRDLYGTAVEELLDAPEALASTS